MPAARLRLALVRTGQVAELPGQHDLGLARLLLAVLLARVLSRRAEHRDERVDRRAGDDDEQRRGDEHLHQGEAGVVPEQSAKEASHFVTGPSSVDSARLVSTEVT